MRDLPIAYGNSCYAKTWANKTTTWEDLCERLKTTIRTTESMKHDAPLAKFDPLVWQAVINYATVNRNCTFTFRDGTEKTVPIKNGVRPYTKRNKPQEVDGNDG